MRRFLGVFLSLCFMMSTIVLANGSQFEYTAIQSRYVNAKNIMADLYISGTTAECKGHVDLKSTKDRVTVLTELYSNENGSWKVACSWVDHSYGKISATAEGSVAVKRGISYKVKVAASVYNAQGKLVETITKETPIRKA